MENEISNFLSERIDERDFPSAVYLISEKDRIVDQGTLGAAVVEPEQIAARTDTIYDLASLTKPLVTGLILAMLMERSEIALDDPVSRFLPNIPRDKTAITIRGLATHTSGMKDWLPVYLVSPSRIKIIKTLTQTPLGASIGEKVVYSDLNFILLAEIIKQVTGMRVDVFCERENIFKTLSLTGTYFNPPPALKHRIAASECGNAFEKQTCRDLGYLKPKEGGTAAAFRDLPIWGEVHDGNAYYMGGVSGHAGLFSTAEDVFKIARQFLPQYTSLFKTETCGLFTTNFTPGMNEHRSLAFQLASTPESTASAGLSPESFGHLGFTGTSVWIDPVNERIFVLLTNRTHDRDVPFQNINSVRRRFHELGIGFIKKVSN